MEKITKICTKCGIAKLPYGFSKNESSKDGLQSTCKLCQKRHYLENREQRLEQIKQQYQDNKEQILERRNKEKRNEQNNKEKANALEAKRKATKLYQTPIDVDKQIIEQLYHICIETNEILREAYFHVDHIQPISKGGLHHQDNLQILEAELNLEKYAKWPLTDEEQIRYKGLRCPKK